MVIIIEESEVMRNERNVFGAKSSIEVVVSGHGRIDRQFRNKGEAIDWLRKQGYAMHLVKFVKGGEVDVPIHMDRWQDEASYG